MLLYRKYFYVRKLRNPTYVTCIRTFPDIPFRYSCVNYHNNATKTSPAAFYGYGMPPV